MAFAIDHVVCGGGNCTAQGPCYYEEISPTLKAGEVHGVAYTAFSCGGFGSYEESCTCGSLRVKEPYGGGEALIVEPLTFDARGNGGAES